MSAGAVSYEHIRLDHAGPLTWLVLNRPDRANALSAAMLDEISDALARLRAEGGPVIAIRGEGRGFSAGMDLGEVGKATGHVEPTADRDRLQRNVERWLAIWDHPKPVIAAVHGYCVAAATQMCVFADLTIVAEDAWIAEPGVPIGGGFIAPVWSTIVGPKRAKELAFVPGNGIDGTTAAAWGWANHAVPASELLGVVEALAASIAKIPADVLRVKKLSINRAAEALGFRAAVAHVAEMDALLHGSASVSALRAQIAERGLKPVLNDYRTPSTAAIVAAARAASKGSERG